MMNRKRLSRGVLTVMAVVTMVGCSKSHDLFDESGHEQQQKNDYATNFVKKYGAVDPEQTWDFAHMYPTYSLSGSASQVRGATRAVVNADNSYTTIGDWYEVDVETIEWMKKRLPDGYNHEALGNPFYMIVPQNEFSIVPIYQGTGDFVWTLHLVVEDFNDQQDDLDITVWTKNENIQKNESGNEGDWQDVGPVDPNTNYRTSRTHNTKTAKFVRAKPITFKNLPAGKSMYLYLSNLKSGVTRASASSLAHQMLALNIHPDSVPNLDDDYKKMIIGCEDQAVYEKSDHDFEDVVFMMYGKPDVPEIKEITEPVKETVSKRYMVEDLGETDDFDFNDIVVDVLQTTTKTAVYKINEDGTRTFLRFEGDPTVSQKAVIRAMGGTLDFELTIGNMKWSKSGSGYAAGTMVNTGADGQAIDYNATLAEFDVTGWNSETNNISVKVGSKGSGNVMTIVFPKKGEVPMIIAVDTNWMKERVSVPSSWFTIPDDDDEGE